MEQMNLLETEKAKMAEKYKLELMSTKQKLEQTQQEMDDAMAENEEVRAYFQDKIEAIKAKLPI